MKISLIFPPFSNSIRTSLPKFIDQSEGYFPPLGILYVASYIQKHKPEYPVQVIDAALEQLNHRQIAEKAAAFGADIVGMSCWTFSLLDTFGIAREIKRISPKTFIVLGGPHMNIYPKESLRNDFIDFAICGNGEKPFLELIDQIAGNRDYSKVSNLYYKQNGTIELSGIEYLENNLNELPFPDRTLTDYKKYYSIIDKVHPFTTIISSRGCPFKCNFCFQQDSGWRSRSTQNIIEEMEYCIGIGIRNFFFFDETFTVNKKRTIDFCKQVIAKNFDIVWSCRSRIDTMDVETIDWLKKAGCNRVSFGIETANPEVQKLLNKPVSISKAVEIFNSVKKNGIMSLGDFMIGCPGEHEKETKETIDLACKLNPDYAQFTILTLFPATKLYDEALKNGIIKTDVWKDYALNPSVDFKAPLWNIYTEEQASKLLVQAYKRFYMRPGYAIRKILGIKSFKELLAYLTAGIGMLKSILLPSSE